MMAKLKLPSTALHWFFSHSRYDLYDCLPEKPLRLVDGSFNLAIRVLFTRVATVSHHIIRTL